MIELLPQECTGKIRKIGEFYQEDVWIMMETNQLIGWQKKISSFQTNQ